MPNDMALFIKETKRAYDVKELIYIEKPLSLHSYEEFSVKITNISNDYIYIKTTSGSLCWAFEDIEDLTRESNKPHVVYNFYINNTEYYLVMNLAL